MFSIKLGIWIHSLFLWKKFGIKFEIFLAIFLTSNSTYLHLSKFYYPNNTDTLRYLDACVPSNITLLLCVVFQIGNPLSLLKFQKKLFLFWPQLILSFFGCCVDGKILFSGWTAQEKIRNHLHISHKVSLEQEIWSCSLFETWDSTHIYQSVYQRSIIYTSLRTFHTASKSV